jgi:NADP-dependent 3-hydroxy acid dehydrogenase YdfG
MASQGRKAERRHSTQPKSATSSNGDHGDHGSELRGKAVVITGGTTGIGRATAKLLAQRGASVLIFGRHERELSDAMTEIQKAAAGGANGGGKISGLTADVSRPGDCKRVFEQADRDLGGVDILVNNAAVAGSGVLDGNSEDWRYSIETNILGYIVCTREAIDRMRKRGAGHIVNVGSMSADLREPENDVYAATKAAVQALSESLRKSVNKENIRITLIEPGAVATPMQEKSPPEERQRIEQKKMLTADDIARCVVFCLEQPERMDVVAVQVRPLMQLI